MQCVKCRGKTLIVNTRSSDTVTYRKRKCTKCGHEFYTEEAEASDGPGVKLIMNHILDMKYKSK